jgi:hypothetical protein
MVTSNLGAGRTLTTAWFDEIYLSTNDTLDPRLDRSLGQLLREGDLAGTGSYTQEVEVTVPEDIIGDVFLIGATDSEREVAEVDETNNIVIQPLTVNLTPPADLRATSIQAPDAVVAGQSVTITWTVENEGSGPTRSNADSVSWYDYLYLSSDRVLDEKDALLAVRPRLDGLEAGQSYTDSVRVAVPTYASGAHHIVVQTDQRNDVYEHAAEGDNLSFERVDLTLPAPTDIVVGTIDVPAAAVPGEAMTVSWIVRNEGSNPARGTMRDALFLSSDATWDVDDPILGTSEREIDLAPGAELEASAKIDLRSAYLLETNSEVTEVVPGLSPGAYFVIVRADIANGIRETDDENNTVASTEPVDVDFATLTLGEPSDVSLVSAQAQYYRLQVGEGEDVRITLTTDTPASSNELYVSFEETPSPGGEGGFSAAEPFTAGQTLVIPSTQDGSYFVLVYARSVPGTGESENITVLAELLGFEVSSVTPNVGGQGQVTTTVEGAGFREDDSILLRGAQGTVEGLKVETGSSTESTIRFLLDSAELGTYDLVVQRPDGGEEAVLETAFEVEEAMPQTVTVEEAIPEAFRFGGRAEFLYRYVNTGNVDIDYMEAQFQILETPDLRVETSAGLLKPSDIFPPPDTVASVDYLFAPDSVYVLPLIARDLPPGASVQATFLTDEPGPEAYLFSHFAQAITTEEYLAESVDDLLNERDFILDNSSNIDGETVQLATDEDAWLDYNFQLFVDAGLLDPSDITGSLPKRADSRPMASAEPGLTIYPEAGIGSGYFAEQEFLRITDGGADEETPEEICARGRKRAITKTCGNSHKACDCVRDIKTRCFPFFEIERSEEFAQECSDSFAACKAQMKDQRKLDSSAPTTPAACNCRPNIKSCDPNDIIGPDGYGDEQWVGVTQVLPYSIRFENDPEKALAPAQVVRVNHRLDEDVDARSFRLGDFGFGSFKFSPPENRAHYKTRLDVRDSLGLYVDLTAGIDILAREAFWVFESIDPATGDQPKDDPFAGFLPLNDDRGSGEGFVSYSIRADERSVTGDTIEAKATIYFDRNAPIDTPPVSNTLDADHPVSRVTVLPGKQDSTVFELDWTGNDVGAGINTFAIYVSRNDDPFELYADGLTDTSLLFVAEDQNRYRFFVLAQDYVGNSEPIKSSGEAGTTVPIEELFNESLPKEFALHGNYPNPFNPTTNIEYDLPSAVRVRLTVYDVLGRQVATLVDADQAGGRYRIIWDAAPYASGTYFYRLEAGEYAKTVKMIVLK